MASTPAADAALAATPDIVGQIILVDPDQVDASNRLRPVDPVWVEALGGILAAEGQRTPIEICRLPGRAGYTLVTGAHRHAAAARMGLQLRAEVVTNDAAERRLREISENLHRRDLAPLDRAAFLAELVAVHKVRAGIDPSVDGRTASVNARWQKSLKNEADDTTATIAFVYGWNDAIADSVGLASRTVRDALLLHRRLPASGVAELRAVAHPILNNAAQLRALAKMEEGQQRKVIRCLTDGAKNIADARKMLFGEDKKSLDQRRFNAALNIIGRMTRRERMGLICSALFHDKYPAPVRKILASIANEEAA